MTIYTYLTQPPFPTGETEAEAIVNVSLMFAIFFIITLMIVLMLYLYMKLNIRGKFLPIFIVWMFSINVAFNSMASPFFPFTPFFQVFFMLFQTSILTLTGLELYNGREIK